jgi:hypothetical protein
MIRRTASIAFALATALPLVAQSAPAGWRQRVDRSTSAQDPDAAGAIKFVTMGKGFHATNPQAAVYWNPANTASGTYTVHGSFTLEKPSGHTNYYGLVFAGSELDGSNQQYLYFLVAQDGTWLIKHRIGEQTHSIAPKTPNDAVKKPDATGKSTNVLEVRTNDTQTDFVINGTVVQSFPKIGLMSKVDGIYGIRINHMLEVHIDDFGVTKK